MRVLLEKMNRSTKYKFSFSIGLYSIRMKHNFNRVGEKMLDFINHKSRKIIFVICLLLFSLIFMKDDYMNAQSFSLNSKIISVEKNTNYIVDISPEFIGKDLNELVRIQCFDENDQPINIPNLMEKKNQQLVFYFTKEINQLKRLEIEPLVDNLFPNIPLQKNQSLTLLVTNNFFDIEFYSENGIAGISWVKENNYLYEVYGTNEQGEQANELLTSSKLIKEMDGSSLLLSNEEDLNNNLYLSYFVLAKKNNETVAFSNVLTTNELQNKIPIRIIELLPKEITSVDNFVSSVTVEMFGGATQKLPVYYEQIDEKTFTYSIIQTPIINQRIIIHPSVVDEIMEEYTYRQMTYPTYFQEDSVKLTLSKNLIDINTIYPDFCSEVQLNDLVITPTTTKQLQVLTRNLKNRETSLDVSNYPLLRDKNFLQKAVDTLAEKEIYFYAIETITIDLKENRLLIKYDIQMEEEETINERVRQSMTQLDGSLESMYQFLITDTIFSNQSKRLTAYSLVMLAKPFGYDISVVKVVENGSVSYINKVQMNNKTFYIDVSKNVMTTGIQNTPFIMKPEELSMYGISLY